MKIALLEPIGVSKEVIDELSAPITEKGHEFVYYDTPIGSNNAIFIFFTLPFCLYFINIITSCQYMDILKLKYIFIYFFQAFCKSTHNEA